MFCGEEGLSDAFQDNSLELVLKIEGCPLIPCAPPASYPPKPCSRVFFHGSIGRVLFSLALLWCGVGVGDSLEAPLLSAAVEGFVCLPLFPKESVAASARKTLSTDTKAENHRLAYCPQNN